MKESPLGNGYFCLSFSLPPSMLLVLSLGKLRQYRGHGSPFMQPYKSATTESGEKMGSGSAGTKRTSGRAGCVVFLREK